MADQVTSYNEEWASIEGFEEAYQVSNYGRVKSLERYVYGKSKRKHNERIIKLMQNTSHGYPMVSLCLNGIKKSFLVHKLVAKSFLPLNSSRTYVNHKDGDKKNCHISNLEWVSNRENTTHGIVKLSNKNIEIGIRKEKVGKPWRSSIYHNGKSVNIGKFETKELAKEAYFKKMAELGIENKYLN
jgi:hypothetical protein